MTETNTNGPAPRKRLYPNVSCVTVGSDDSLQRDIRYFDIGAKWLDFRSACIVGSHAFYEVAAEIGRESDYGLVRAVTEEAVHALASSDRGISGAATGYLSALDEFVHRAAETLSVADVAKEAMDAFEKCASDDLESLRRKNAELMARLSRGSEKEA